MFLRRPTRLALSAEPLPGRLNRMRLGPFRRNVQAALSCLVLAGLLLLPSLAPAADAPKPADATARPFRVTIEIRLQGDAAVLDRHLILFAGQKVYDFALTDPHDVTVIDPAHGTVTLLSREKQVKSTIGTGEIATYTAKVRTDARLQGIENRVGIGVQATAAQGSYELAFGDYQYRVATVAPDFAGQAARFVEFTDWAGRINLVRKLGPPPFARMKLGRQIAGDDRLPADLLLTCQSPDANHTFDSRYRYAVGLRDADQKRIEEANQLLALCREIPFSAFPK